MDWTRIEHEWMSALTVLMVIGEEGVDWMPFPIYRELLFFMVNLRDN